MGTRGTMKRHLAPVACGLALGLGSMGIAPPAEAVTLGRARGALTLGQPLSIAVPLSLAPGETATCLQAELVQGNARSGPLDMALLHGDSGPVIRIRSSAKVTEPVVTVDVQVGCGRPSKHSIVLVAEQEAAAPSSDKASAEMVALRAAVLEQTAATKRLMEHLDKPAGERDLANALLAFIAGMLVAGGVAMLVMRLRDSAAQKERWHPGQGAAGDASSSRWHKRTAPPADGGAPADNVSEVDSGWEAVSEVNSSTGDSSTADVERSHPRRTVASPMGEFAESQVGHDAIPRPRELIDYQQRVEFFLAIGQEERAIQLLEVALHGHLGGSPFFWLQLLDLCRLHGKREQYEGIREAFEQKFEAPLPAFDAEVPEPAGLEQYPELLARIVQLWGSRQVCDAIEDALAEGPHFTRSVAFDLDASRDALLLYAIASDRVSDHGAAPPQPARQ